MTMQPPAFPLRAGARAITIGECMVELARGADGRFGLAYGGDTFNTAVYMARGGAGVSYATALGDDPYSAGILALARTERVGTELIEVMGGRMPGLYMIETTPEGERTFWYWRDRAAARGLFESAKADETVAAIAAADLVYFSGVTLSLYSAKGLNVLADALTAARTNGGIVVMDSNYRPRGWGGDLARARSTFERFWRLSHVALPTFDDEQMLWNDATPAHTADRLTNLGITEIVIKNGAAGATVRAEGRDQLVMPPPLTAKIVDTTAAGDSFNAAYLTRRMRGVAPADAALDAHKLAAIVIQHPGAIVPARATAAVLGPL
jgi:2-dehydro-3-deoxygluconokinase